MDGGLTTRKAFLLAAGTGAAGTALAAALGAFERPEAKLGDRIVAARRGGAVPADDPVSDAWFETDPVLVRLLPQRLVPPYLEPGGLDEITVEALHNGEELAFRLGWDDPDVDDIDGLARFRDAAAVQIPAQLGQTPPPIMMGGPGAPVHILQWRATWQRDLVDRVTVETVYPNVIHDEPPEAVLPPEVARLFYVGRIVGNPLSALGRASPVEEIVAEGFGSVTSLPEQRARGGAVHSHGRWLVTIGLGLERSPAAARIELGSVWPVGFAVWLGSRDNRGSRKQYADWIELEVER